jgi:glycosyltransferase involved in cell wall biosynthesis
LGTISDQKLNKLYNSSKFLFLPSKAEGLGLTMIEAMVCGSLPITCSDNRTTQEFLPDDFICEPNAESIAIKIQKLTNQYDEKRELALKYGKKYKIQFDKVTIAKNIINIFNLKKNI